MSFNWEELRDIYDRTSGKCHICHKKLSFKNYGAISAHAPWEVEHSVAQARGGTSRLNNLYAACISCNRSKQAMGTRAARARNGLTRAPLSKTRRNQKRAQNAVVGATLGTVAAAILAPQLWVGAALVGAFFGHGADPDA